MMMIEPLPDGLALFLVSYIVLGLFVVGFVWPSEEETEKKDLGYLSLTTFIMGVILWPVIVGAFISGKK